MKKLFLLICLLWGVKASCQNESDLKMDIYQIKVSEGHATLVVVKIRGARGRFKILSSTLIDAGKDITNDANLITGILDNVADSKLDNVFITHYDADHFNGLKSNTGSSTGILAKRCGDNNTLESSTNNELHIYRSHNDAATNNPKPEIRSLIEQIDGFEDEGRLSDFNWNVNTPTLNLSPHTNSSINNKVKLITLAVNGDLKNSGLKLKIKNKNSRSGVMLITWGDFSFLVQGDLQAGGGSSQKIGRTNAYYRTTNLSDAKRIPANWELLANNSNASAQKAKDLPLASVNGIAGIKRVVNKDVTKSTVSVTNVPLSLASYPYDIAYPEEWHHVLGQRINDYNGDGGYAQACMALAPHHGAPTSNLWYDSEYVVIGSNSSNNHGHPVPQAIAAAYHTSGARNFFFTYLQNAVSRGTSYNRFNEVTEWKNNIGNSVNLYKLGTNEDYLKFAVSHSGSSVKNVTVTCDECVTPTNNPITFTCDY